MKRIRNKTVKILLIVFLAVCCVALRFILQGDRMPMQREKVSGEEKEQAVSAIRQMEEENEAYFANADTTERQKLEESELQEERQKILNLKVSEIDKSSLLSRFEHAVIMGDSLTAAAVEYGYMTAAVDISKNGADIVSSGELFEELKKAKPQTAFLCLGVNDIEKYGENVDRYIDAYRVKIQDLTDSLPDCAVYVQGLLPPSEQGYQSFYQYRDTYNEELQSMCSELGVNYIDSSFILEEMPELYDTDGVHPTADFYPLWLTWLADCAGL